MEKLSVQEYGVGKPVVLIHGFPFSKKMWENFAPELASSYKVYAIDLPGFGQSPSPAEFSLPAIARQILNWIREKSIPPCAVIGHSLGGYIALSMVAQQPDLFAGLGLFHSTATADTDDKKQSREKVIEFIEKNGASAFTGNSVAPLYADKNHPSIAIVKAIAAEVNPDVLIGYSRAMRDRQDTTSVFGKFPRPILFILGKEDPGIPVETVTKQAAMCQQAQLHVLPSVGHMGMFEAKVATVSAVRGFLNTVFGI